MQRGTASRLLFSIKMKFNTTDRFFLIASIGVFSFQTASCDPVEHLQGVVVDSSTRQPISGVDYVRHDIAVENGKGMIDSNYIVSSSDVMGQATDSTGRFKKLGMSRADDTMYFLKPGYRPVLALLPKDTIFLTKR